MKPVIVMEKPQEKLTSGEALTAEELLEYLPTLKEVPATLLKQYAVGAAVRPQTIRCGRSRAPEFSRRRCSL